MEGKDIRNVIKWTGYIYAPIIMLFVAIYLLVQYRLHEIASLRTHSSPVEVNANSDLSLPRATSSF